MEGKTAAPVDCLISLAVPWLEPSKGDALAVVPSSAQEDWNQHHPPAQSVPYASTFTMLWTETATTALAEAVSLCKK